MTLPRAPLRIEVVDDLTPPQPAGFLRLRRLMLRVARDGSAASEAHPYDLVERRALDAVVLLLHDRDPARLARVLLRSGVRPPLALRADPLRTLMGSPAGAMPDPHPGAATWELPAGLVEPDEIAAGAAAGSPELGLRLCATREALEETGHRIAPESWTLLGAGAFLSPGLSAEKIFYLAAPLPHEPPEGAHGDGTPFELHAETRLVPIDRVLADARSGTLEDLKTEAGVARLRDWLASRSDAG